MTVDDRMLGFVAEHHGGVLATIKHDGRPQVSNVGYAYDPEQRLFRVSVTDSRAKTRNLRTDPRLTLHVAAGVPDSFLEELKEVVGHHPGDHELLLAVGARRLALGAGFRVSASSSCRAELGQLQGAARVVA